MADAVHLTQATNMRSPAISPVTLVRVVIIVAILAGWEALAQSGLLYRDVVPEIDGPEIDRDFLSLARLGRLSLGLIHHGLPSGGRPYTIW